ncbi:MAG: LemA protein [Oceanicoccus sp.]|jgi:LemA protein
MAKNKFKVPKWGVALGIVIILALWVGGQYNTLVDLDVAVENSWADVEVQYERRADLIPQLIATVSGAANFEQDTLIAVTEARTNWLDTQADPNASLEDQMESAGAFDSALSRLLVTVEAYPTITATEGFLALQVQLEGTENRVSIAREDFNAVASDYNGATRKIPMMFFARVFGFDRSPLFEASTGSEEAPTVEFDIGSDDE